VSSSLDDHPTLYIRNPSRFQITEISISNSVHDPYITFPVTSAGIAAIPNTIDLLEFTQDPNVKSISPNKFLLKLAKDKCLELKFKFSIGETDGNKSYVKGLTFINVASEKELERIVTVEFNDDPNSTGRCLDNIINELMKMCQPYEKLYLRLHKHPKVSLVGNYESDGIKPLEMEWNWMWSAPHNMDEVHRGWRNYCCFAEYDAKDNTFQLLAAFTFWVADSTRGYYHRASKSTGSLDGTSFLTGTSSLLQSSTSAPWSLPRSVRPSSPDTVYLPVPGMSSHTSGTASSISSGGRRSSDDLMFQHEPEDGPLFRATLSSYEKKTGSLRQYIKRILKAASASHEVMLDSNEADDELMVALRAAATAHPQAFQPVLDSYLEDAAKKIAHLRENLANQMSILLIEPLRKMYENDIKVADSKKKEFEDESRDYYQFLSKYLSMKVDSAKEKKKLETDSKYQNKRKTFELKRFDYYAYMQDLHGGRKDQEILYHLTNFAEKQFAFYQQTAMSIQNLKPGLDKLAVDVAETTKEIHLMRKEREERRRALETRAITANPFTGETLNEGENSNNCNGSASTDSTTDNAENQTLIHAGSLNTTQNKFKGIRDLDQQGNESASTAGRRKEGFLFATSRATQHGTVDPIAKNNWHKYWCVLAGGQLCEYSNWKKQLETHNEPINLRFATVREARGADRRFCFEVITPQYRRIYQAISAEDMSSWMAVISNAIESLLNGTSSCRNLDQVLTQDVDSTGAGTLFSKKALQRRGTLPSLSEKRKCDMKKGTPVLSEEPIIKTQSKGRNRQEMDENAKSVRIIESIKGADISNTSCAD
ncbi:7352_t:CDS:2, partial [Racocetra persica]